MLDIEMTRLRKLEESDLDIILSWRNHDEIRTYMMNDSLIKYEDHLQWFKKNQNRLDRLFYVFEYQSIPKGYVSYHKIDNSPAYEWGFYISPNAEKGMGTLLGKTALKYAFEQLNFEKIFGQVLSFNHKSLSFHKKLGFVQEGVLRKHFQDKRGKFDLIQFGLFKSEWKE